MSAFLSSADAINALATYWHQRQNRHQLAKERLRYALSRANAICTSYDVNKEASQVIARKPPFDAVFHLLLAENIRSLQHRYPSEPEMWATDETYKPRLISCVETWSEWKQTSGLVGILRGYVYQSCEHKGWRTSVAHEICDQIKDELLSDYRDTGSHNNEDFFWASWTEPRSEESPHLS